MYISSEVKRSIKVLKSQGWRFQFFFFFLKKDRKKDE